MWRANGARAARASIHRRRASKGTLSVSHTLTSSWYRAASAASSTGAAEADADASTDMSVAGSAGMPPREKAAALRSASVGELRRLVIQLDDGACISCYIQVKRVSYPMQ
jgi:hypothetical protein